MKFAFPGKGDHGDHHHIQRRQKTGFAGGSVKQAELLEDFAPGKADAAGNAAGNESPVRQFPVDGKCGDEYQKRPDQIAQTDENQRLQKFIRRRLRRVGYSPDQSCKKQCDCCNYFHNYFIMLWV